jgi:pyruvate dehydrogenase E2 component (dihydrolipoamide acetyltransferase)
VFITAKEFKFPDVGEGIHEGTIVKWHFKEGDSVKADQTIVEVETDKAVVELPAPASGTILRINHKEGDVVKVGEVLVVIGEAGEKVEAPAEKAPAAEAARPAAAHEAPADAAEAKPAEGRILATPATRKLARELGVDLSHVKGSGPAGRITDEDVKAAAGSAPAAKAVQTSGAPQPAAAPVEAPAVATAEGDVRVPLTHLRKVIAERMVYSKTHIPHACGMDFVDVTRLTELREKEKKNFEPRGVKLTYLPFIVKACAVALKEMPDFNAHFDETRSEVVLKRQHNIGIAVDTPEGLMVPVVKDVDRRSVIEIAQEIEHLAALAKERKLKLDDMKGGTFTITNIGSVGGMYSTPIINPPEVAIMGVHRIKDMPMVMDGKVKARKVMGLSLCFDHRVVDGAAATKFMNIVMKHLSDPDLMLVDMI